MKHYMMLISIFIFTAIISLINQMIYAYYFGTSSSFDMLNAVLALPLSIIGVGNGAITLIIMPILNEAKKKYGNCVYVLVDLIKKYILHIILLTIILVMIQIILLQNRVDTTQKDELIYLSLFVGIYLFLNFINSFFVVYFNFKKKFILASINALVIYIFSIIMCLLFAKTIGVKIVIFSFIFSNMVLLFYFIMIFVNDFKKLSIKQKIISFKIELKVLLSGIFSILPFTLPIFIDSYFLLALGSGNLSYVSYANKIIIMISTILIQPLNLILFPKILMKISSKKFIEIKIMLFYLYVFVLLGVVLIYIFSKLFFLDFMHIFFENGIFTSNDSKKINNVFLFYLIGAFGMVSMNIQNKVLTSLKLYKIQIFGSLSFIICYIFLLNFLLQIKGYLSSGIVYMICWIFYSSFIMLYINKYLILKKED